MTTILTQPEPTAAAGVAPRMLSIGVNLLPPEVIESRRGRKVRRIVVIALAGFTALLAAWYGAVSLQGTVARSDLSRAENDVVRMQRQQRDFDGLVRTQQQSKTINGQLSALLAKNVDWARLLTALQQAAPNGIQLLGVSSTLTAADKKPANGGAAAQLPSTTAEKVIGTLTLTGDGSGKPAVAAYVDALAKVPGVANALLGEVTPQDGRMHFSVRLDITEKAIGSSRTSTSSQSGGK
jgi:hypothetical protein